ncbi:hypothetical protein [Maribacter sp. Asnod1-A12]|uniref:hypothetical protein n=1 Tax=Maribacter sp. Asnod1-A12 TaxID=3160576 RepID=UPI003865E711
MIVRANSTDKIERQMDYLETEISKLYLDLSLGKLYLYGLWVSRLNGELVLRPKWTFAVPDYNKYLSFFKTHNLIHWGGGSNKFLLDKDLFQSYKVIVEIKDSDTVESILDLGRRIPEFKNLYSKALA